MKRKYIYPPLFVVFVFSCCFVINKSVSDISDAVVTEAFKDLQALNSESKNIIAEEVIQKSYDKRNRWSNDIADISPFLHPVQKPFFEWQVRNKIFNINNKYNFKMDKGRKTLWIWLPNFIS